jgi:hypothetical protein
LANKNTVLTIIIVAGLCAQLFASDALQPSPVDVLAKKGSILAFRSGETWRQLDTNTGKVSSMHPLGLAPDMPCVIGGYNIVRGQINGVDILGNYNPPYCAAVDARTVMMGGNGVPDAIVQWPLGSTALLLERKPRAEHDNSRYFSASQGYYWTAANIFNDGDAPETDWVLQRYPGGLTVRPPKCTVYAFEAMGNSVFLGTTKGLLKISLPTGKCTLYTQAPRIDGLEELLRKSLNWSHVITGLLEVKGRTLYCGYFDVEGGASFIISRDKKTGYMSLISVPIAGLQAMFPIDGSRIALAGCVLKNYGAGEYAYFGGFAVYNTRSGAVKVINSDPVSNIVVSSQTIAAERVLGLGEAMGLMWREIITHDLSKIQELERSSEVYGLDEPEKYSALKNIHDTVLARRQALPEIKPTGIIGYVLPQRALISTEKIPSRVVPVSDTARSMVTK